MRLPNNSRKHSGIPEKYFRYGVTNLIQYRFVRTLAVFEEAVALLGPRLRRRRYAQIIPLGVNCDVAFRFYRKWKFLDSSLLAWAQTYNIKTLVGVLRNLDNLFAGKVTFEDGAKMWKCWNSGTLFHGRLKWDENNRFHDDRELAADLADLRGRIIHLKGKFILYLANDIPTLIVHRLSDEDAICGELDARLRTLENALTALGMRNCTLLIVTETRHLAKMPSAPNRIFRAVREFNPRNRVTDLTIGDSLGWKAIFTEFAPMIVLGKRHAFKFE